jgi:hypothetical protein
MSLYKHQPHPHKPRNVNHAHKEEQANAGLNQRIAVAITKMTGTMFCAYIFALLALLGFPALSVFFSPLVAVYIVWVSQTFIQLCMLPILSVGQSVLGRKAELQADEQFATTQKSFHDIEQIMCHLDAQDKELIRQSKLIEDQNKLILQLLERKKRTPRKVETKGQVL